MFEITFTPESVEDLRILRKTDQQKVLTAVAAQLIHQAVDETRNRKRLRPNELAEWELRVGDCRVFYDADEVSAVVKIVAVGYKQGNKLFIHGEEFEL